MITLGCHLSAAKGYLDMAQTAVSIGANTFQFFTRNPRGGKAKALDDKDIAAFESYRSEHGIGQILAHAPYTMNGCSADPSIRRFATDTMADDLRRMEATPGNLYNFHPGSHVGQGTQEGIRMIVEMLDEAMFPEMHTTVLLETMAGKGSEIGRSFQELREIIDRAKYPEHLGVCIDTCHVWDAGYDIRGDLDGVLTEFDNIVGLNRVKAVHVNDSMNPLGAHKDRHAKIGQGHIGLEAILHVITHPALNSLVLNLETPNDLTGYEAEIALLRQEAEK